MYSGRWGGQPTKEGTGALVLDVNRLLRAVEGRPTTNLRWTWQLAGKPIQVLLQVELEMDDYRGRLRVLHGNITHLSADTGPQNYLVTMVAKPCQFGGRRWFFLCPRTGRRSAKLYLPNGGRRFWSRGAYGLAYASQRCGFIGQAHARLERLHDKLGASYSGTCTGLPPRPKGMRTRTYTRLVEEIDAAYVALEEEFCAGAERILSRAGQVT
jgi:hypothetical protein